MEILRVYDIRLMKMYFTHGKRLFKGKRPEDITDTKIMNITVKLYDIEDTEM